MEDSDFSQEQWKDQELQKFFDYMEKQVLLEDDKGGSPCRQCICGGG